MRRRHLETSIFDDSPDDLVADPEPVASAVEAPPSRRSDRHRDAKLRHRQRVRRVTVMLIALALVAGAGIGATLVLRPMVASMTASNDYTGGGTGAVSVVVRKGDSGRAIGAVLEKAGVVKTADAFENAAAGNAKSGSIQPGTYALRSKMSAASALTALLNPTNRTVPKVTVREGLWTSETISALSKATGRPLADYTAALKDPAMLGLPAVAKGSAEGYLFPSTYEFEKDTTAGEQLHTMVARTLEELAKLGVSPGQMQRVLTVASLVEAEANADADRPKVARVIENRLARPMPLQLDSTVHFITQRRGKVGTSNAQRASQSPYNTYLVAGLPPGPIDSPGLSALKAAVSPTPGPWIYFVAVNPSTGETRFAVDVEGHTANVKLFLAWCSRNPKHC